MVLINEVLSKTEYLGRVAGLGMSLVSIGVTLILDPSLSLWRTRTSW